MPETEQIAEPLCVVGILDSPDIPPGRYNVILSSCNNYLATRCNDSCCRMGIRMALLESVVQGTYWCGIQCNTLPWSYSKAPVML